MPFTLHRDNVVLCYHINFFYIINDELGMAKSSTGLGPHGASPQMGKFFNNFWGMGGEWEKSNPQIVNGVGFGIALPTPPPPQSPLYINMFLILI